VARYGQAFKDRAVPRLLLPESASVGEVSLQVGVAVTCLGLSERFYLEILAAVVDTLPQPDANSIGVWQPRLEHGSIFRVTKCR
jgi:hypothetical protein